MFDRKSIRSINRLVSCTIVILWYCNFPAFSREKAAEQLWQEKTELVINHLADNYKIPSKGDRGKYAMPALIAYRWRYRDRSWQPDQTKYLQFLSQKKAADFYTNSDAFKAPGITRLLYLFPQNKSLEKVEKEYFRYLFSPQKKKTKYNFWQSGGTENFVNMLRTSGYLLAQKAIDLKLPTAEQKLADKEKWLRYKARKTYQMGVSEWDSSSYTVFNVIGWLNLYDFAENPEIKAIAKAVLDYYASAIALKYTHGVYGGAEQRGGSATSSYNSHTDYLGWLWFSDYLPEDTSFFSWPQYIQLIHPATSSYRPPPEAIELAQKNESSTGYYRNSKANYGLARLEVPEVFYLQPTYTLGTALVRNGAQIVNWKLVSYPEHSASASVVTGSNSYNKNQTRNGMGKTIYDRYLQHENILVQMTYVPPEAKSQLGKQNLRQFLVNLINKIPCGNTCRYRLTIKLNKLIAPAVYPIKKNNHKHYIANYLSFPKQTKLINRQGIYFVELDRTYLAIFPFPEQPNLKLQTIDDRSYLEITAPLNSLAGFLIEVGNQLEHQSLKQFQNLILTESKLDLKQLEWEKIRYKNLNNQQLFIDYEKNQTQASLKINNQPVTFPLTHLYNGEQLRLKERILELESDDSIYQVNFQQATPTFKRFAK